MSEAELPRPARRVAAALAEAGIETRIVITAESARTAQEAAVAVGTEVGAIVKSLVFLAGDEPVLALVSGSNRLDEKALGACAGARIRRADADAVREATGYAIGGVPPLGLASDLRVFLDRDLLGYDEVWAAAGTPHAVFPVAPQALLEATGAVAAKLAHA